MYVCVWVRVYILHHHRHPFNNIRVNNNKISMHLNGNQNIHKMKCFAISYTVLVLVSGIFNCSFQLCAARPEEVKKSGDNQTESSTAATKSDANESITNEILTRNSEEELAFKKCGIPNRMGLNKGGLEFLSSGQTKAGEFPWTVAILRKLNQNSRKQTLLYSGAGTLIHPMVVLTAANKHHAIEMDIVRAGEWDFGTLDEEHPYQNRDIASIYSLDNSDPDSVQLIFVTEPFLLTINVRTVCLPLPGSSTATIPEKRDCTTAAWGQQNCSFMKGLHSILGRAELSTETKQSTCETDWQQYLEDNTFKLKNNQFCTMRKHSIDDACFCDHGAPLFCPIQTTDDKIIQYEQIGVSIASGGCTRELPGIFSNLLEQRLSIDKIFSEKGLDPSYYTA